MVRAGGGVAVGAGEAQAGLLSHPLDEVGATAPVGGGEPRFGHDCAHIYLSI